MTRRFQRFLPLIVCVIASYMTYVFNFPNPPHFFWDENYYLTGAEKYKEGVFFMQTHPPLGKLVIALGDVMLDPNSEIKNDFINFDHAKDSPPNFSFTGYRLFPVVMGGLGGVIFFYIFLSILGNPWWAASLSSLYIFDNAQIIQSRGAMLDSVYTFFLLLYFLFSLKLFLETKRVLLNIVLASLSFAFLVTTKDSGFFFAPLLAIGIGKLFFPNWPQIFKHWGLALACFFGVFISVWCIHYNLFRTLNPNLRNQGRYEASDESLNIILQSKWVAPWDLLTLLPENYRFVKKDHAGIPKLNLCKPDENGSPVWLWPLGVRAINYRWETNDSGKTYRYLNIIANPVTWGVSLVCILFFSALMFAKVFTKIPTGSFFSWPTSTFLVLYFLYLLILNSYDRVFFLYSYFPSLNISFILLAFLIRDLKELPIRPGIHRALPKFFTLLPILSFVCFVFFSPFTYNLPMNREQFKARAWLKLWNLRCVNCPREGIFIPKD